MIEVSVIGLIGIVLASVSGGAVGGFTVGYMIGKAVTK